MTTPKQQLKSSLIEIDETRKRRLTETDPMFERNNRDSIPVTQTRKILPTRRSVSGVYPFRCETSIQFESTLERDFLIEKEFRLDVLAVIPQPVQIPYITASGRAQVYTPDFLVYYRLGNRSHEHYPRPLLVEVKPNYELRKHWPKWRAKFRAACRYATEQGWRFTIHDESRIRGQALENIRFLERYKRMQFPVEESQAVVESVRQMGSSSMHYLLARHFMGIYKSQGISHVWHLLATRQLDCDITRPLSDFTELWIPTL